MICAETGEKLGAGSRGPWQRRGRPGLGGAGSRGDGGGVVRGETSCPGSAHYEMEPEISALPGPLSQA